MNCNLDEDINFCQFYDKNKKICIGNKKECGYFENQHKTENKGVESKKGKWFEKYYK